MLLPVCAVGAYEQDKGLHTTSALYTWYVRGSIYSYVASHMGGGQVAICPHLLQHTGSHQPQLHNSSRGRTVMQHMPCRAWLSNLHTHADNHGVCKTVTYAGHRAVVRKRHQHSGCDVCTNNHVTHDCKLPTPVWWLAYCYQLHETMSVTVS